MKKKIYKTVFFLVLALSMGIPVYAGQADAAAEKPATVKVFEEKDFSHLLGMEGFSDEMLKDHFRLYRGYVANSNKLLARLNELLDADMTATAEYAELKRRLGWEMNGMVLHEYYFANLGGTGAIDEDSELYEQIVDDFGSFDRWKKDFIATASMRGIGWVILSKDPATGRLINLWIEQHDGGNVASLRPVLVMDVFEHAYITDYRLDRAGYMGSFFANIDWDEACSRF